MEAQGSLSDKATGTGASPFSVWYEMIATDLGIVTNNRCDILKLSQAAYDDKRQSARNLQPDKTR